MNSPRSRQRNYRQDRYRQRYSPQGRQDSGDWFTDLLANSTFHQVAPLLVVIIVPLLVLFTNRYKRVLLSPLRFLFHFVAMVLQGLGAVFPWNWSTGSRERKVSEKKKGVVRTRAEQIGLANGSTSGSSKGELDDQKNDSDPEEDEDDGYYPGIVNISGTYCFMDSTLQALASLTYLQPHINAIHARAVKHDVPTPVIDALRDILRELNTPRTSRMSLRPTNLIQALSSPGPSSSSNSGRTSNRLFSSREHQDAQELFQVLIEAVKAEAAELDRETGRDFGLGAALSSTSTSPQPNGHGSTNGSAASKDREGEISHITKSVFDGLTANRRSCVECGYTEAVMHFSFDNWQLALPRSNICDLDDCLADYTRLELLTDCICRRCSLEATYEKYSQDGHPETSTLPSNPSSPITNSPVHESAKGETKSSISKSKKKRAQEARKLAGRVKALLDEGRVEEDVKGVQVVKVTKASTKQAMVARPPPLLVLHLNRSLHFGGQYGAAKNSCKVEFPEILDLTPYTTSGMLNTSPQVPISSPGFRSALFNPTPVAGKVDPSTRTLYRLASVVCHYGQHSFGHYVCFRRRPRSSDLPYEKRWEPPSWQAEGEGDLSLLESRRGTGRGWLRISDDDVRECGIENVLQEGSGAFMLYYEKIVIGSASPSTKQDSNDVAPAVDQEHPPPSQIMDGDVAKVHRVYAVEDDERTPRCSEETLKPAKINGYHKANGSVTSLSSTLVEGTIHQDSQGKGGLQGVISVGLSSSPMVKGSWLEPRLVRSVSLSARQIGDSECRPSISRTNSADSRVDDKTPDILPNGSIPNGIHRDPL